MPAIPLPQGCRANHLVSVCDFDGGARGIVIGRARVTMHASAAGVVPFDFSFSSTTAGPRNLRKNIGGSGGQKTTRLNVRAASSLSLKPHASSWSNSSSSARTRTRAHTRTRAAVGGDNRGPDAFRAARDDGSDNTLPIFPSTLGAVAQQVGVGATVAFGGLVFAISFATLVFSGPDAPEGALAAGTSFIMFSGMVGACGIALRSSLPAIAEVQDGPSAIFAIMAAAIYATDGIEEDAKLPTVEAAILLTSTASGALMMALGQAKLGNIVRLLPSPVTGGFLAGTGWVLTTGSFKVLTGLAFEPGNVVVALQSPELLTVCLPGVALGVALAVGNRKIAKFWVVPCFLLGGTFLYFSALQFGPMGMSPADALQAGLLLGRVQD